MRSGSFPPISNRYIILENFLQQDKRSEMHHIFTYAITTNYTMRGALTGKMHMVPLESSTFRRRRPITGSPTRLSSPPTKTLAHYVDLILPLPVVKLTNTMPLYARKFAAPPPAMPAVHESKFSGPSWSKPRLFGFLQHHHLSTFQLYILRPIQI
jgi:hypothetical protein